MMRSLFSGVAGLRTHQTKMDVIGNNIANVNTVAYKAQNITFQDLMYQTTRRASGANPAGGVGGINAGQIGLGVKVGAINTNITLSGAMQTTNLPFDIAITGESFFIVNNGLENLFTRSGSFYVDGVGNLAMTSTGFNVMGWLPDPENPTNIRKDTVQALRVMGEGLMTYPAEATTMATVSGIVDKNDPDINSSTGKVMNLEFYDERGDKFTARLSMHSINGDNGIFYTKLDDILDANGKSIGTAKLAEVSFGGTEVVQSLDNYLRKNSSSLSQTISYNVGTGTPITKTNIVGATHTITGTASPATSLAVGEIGALYGASAQTHATSVAGETVSYTVLRNGTISITKTTALGVADTKSFPIGGEAPATGSTTAITGVELINGTSEIGGASSALAAIPALFTIDDAGLITPVTGFSVSGTAVTNNAAGQAEIRQIITDIFGISLDNVRAFQINEDGSLTVTLKQVENAAIVRYNAANGSFNDINSNTDGLIMMFFNQTADGMAAFRNIELDFSTTLQSNNNKKSTVGATPGGTGENKGVGMGRRIGEMIDVVVQDDGRIYATYSNNQSRLLGQIATASFANASGLEKKGDNLYASSMNSGEFDGIGEDIKTTGGYMSTGVLEMSNVDLSSEFTEMITTQRGFQANSRIITVSDSLLEELTNLKR